MVLAVVMVSCYWLVAGDRGHDAGLLLVEALVTRPGAGGDTARGGSPGQAGDTLVQGRLAGHRCALWTYGWTLTLLGAGSDTARPGSDTVGGHGRTLLLAGG